MQSAPFHAHLAEGPDAGRAIWVTTVDGVRLRLGLFETGQRGTILIFPGRSEAVEKYGRLAHQFADHGYSSVVIDWRGQGMADRLHDDPMLGHVGHFHDYQLDVKAVLSAVTKAGLPEPYFLLAHSMGGTIGLRALMDGLPVKAAVFSAPMWGVLLPVWARPVSGMLGALSGPLGLSTRYAPTTDEVPYLLKAEFEDNLLTEDQDGFDYMLRQLKGVPELAIAGPSFQWVAEALRECRQLSQADSPDMPVLTGLGTDEQVVCTPSIRERMDRWPGGTLVEVDGGRHELLMETRPRREKFLAPALALFEAALDQNAPPPSKQSA